MNTWYLQLTRPPLTPPSWIFGPVWTVLYLMIAAAIVLFIAKSFTQRPYLTYALVALHVILNAVWTPLFFGLKAPGWALLDIILLDVTLIGLIVIFWRTSRLASALLWPYGAWVLFATYLNTGFVILN